MLHLMKIIAVSLLSLLLIHTPTLNASPIHSSINVFGDSLSDISNDLILTGFAPPPTRYFNGRFSNGPVWVELLAASLGHSLIASENPGGFSLAADDSVSFAYGGSTTGVSNITPGGFSVPGLLGQVSQYQTSLAGLSADSNALNIVYSGANDYLLGFSTNPFDVVANISDTISQLYALGGRNFLVPNLPDLGQIPITMALGLSASASSLSLGHNLVLQQTILGLATTLPDINLISLDVHTLMQDVIVDPAAFGFSSGLVAGPASGCLIPLPMTPPDCSPLPNGFSSTALFWDEQHPTSLFHQLLADRALASMNIPEPGTLFLFFIGLAMTSIFRTRIV